MSPTAPRRLSTAAWVGSGPVAPVEVRTGSITALPYADGTFNEAALRNGDTWAHGLFRVVQIPQWLRRAGFHAIRQNPTLIQRLQLLSPTERRFICDLVRGLAAQAELFELPAGELAAWRKLADTDAEDHIVNDPDFQFRAVQTVFVAQVP